MPREKVEVYSVIALALRSRVEPSGEEETRKITWTRAKRMLEFVRIRTLDESESKSEGRAKRFGRIYGEDRFRGYREQLQG